MNKIRLVINNEAKKNEKEKTLTTIIDKLREKEEQLKIYY